MAPLWNPYTRMRSVFDPARFYGRRSQARSILEGLLGATPSSFLVRGFKLLGKTSLWRFTAHEQGARRELAELWASSPYTDPGKMAWIYVNFHRYDEADFMAAIYDQALQNEVVRHLRSARAPAERSSEPRGSFERLRALLGELREQGIRPVIGLDHFDYVVRGLTPDGEARLANLKDHQAVAFVILMENDPYELNPGVCDPAISCFFGSLNSVHLDLLSPSEARELISDPLAELPPPEPGAEPADQRAGHPFFGQEDAELLLALGGRHPRLLIAACEGLFQLYQVHPELRGRVQSLREQVSDELLGRTDAREVMLAFWGRLDEPEREALHLIARQQALPESLGAAARSLVRKKLVLRNFEDNGYTLFAGLFRDFVLDMEEKPAPRQPALGDLAASLAPLDQKLLGYLAERAERVCSYQQIYEAFWKGEPNQAALSGAISRIRAKLRQASGSDWDGIRTVRGQGYQFVPLPR